MRPGNRTRPPLLAQKQGHRGDFMKDPQKLRELAAWYREYAERTTNSAIWEARLRTAEDLEHEADRLEARQAEPVGFG